MHIYAFGSVCRGEIDKDSDIDLLAILDSFEDRFDSEEYSIYSYDRIKELWKEGNPFAWHLATESKLIYSADNNNYISELGLPNKYEKCREDCLKFYHLFHDSYISIINGENSIVFELSTIFLSLRNFATCYLLGHNRMNFSRYSALQMGSNSISISKETFNLLMRARLLSIRAKGKMIDFEEAKEHLQEIESIKLWMEKLLKGVKNGRI